MFLTSAASIHQLYPFKFVFFYKVNQYLRNLIKKGMLKNANILLYALHRCQITWAGADPGEVKWVNFHPPFSEPPSFFFFLSLKY